MPPRTIRQHVRRQVGNVLIDGFFQLGSAAWRSLPVARPDRHGVTVARNVPYRGGGDRAHLLDVYTPAEKSAAPRPCVLYVHGGSFRILSKESHFMMATEFAKAGYVVFNINYRLAPRHPFPAAVEDVADAYRWVVENAQRWGADPKRLVVAGESAGGNLTVATAIMATYERPEPYARRVYQLGVVPKAIVPLCGILQVTRHSRGEQPLSAFIQDRIDAAGEYYLGDGRTDPHDDYALADPILVLEGGRPVRPFPPAFASAGTRDPIHADTLRLEKVLTGWGVENEARIYPGEPHAFQALTFRRRVREQWRALFEFLETRV
jgi:acetyl esterase